MTQCLNTIATEANTDCTSPFATGMLLRGGFLCPRTLFCTASGGFLLPKCVEADAHSTSCVWWVVSAFEAVGLDQARAIVCS